MHRTCPLTRPLPAPTVSLSRTRTRAPTPGSWSRGCPSAQSRRRRGTPTLSLKIPLSCLSDPESQRVYLRKWIQSWVFQFPEKEEYFLSTFHQVKERLRRAGQESWPPPAGSLMSAMVLLPLLTVSTPQSCLHHHHHHQQPPVLTLAAGKQVRSLERRVKRNRNP